MDTHPSSAHGTRSNTPEVVHIDALPQDIHIEETPQFIALINLFNHIEDTKYKVLDILKSSAIFTKFYDFVVRNIIENKVVVQRELSEVFMSKIEDLRNRYHHDEIGKNRALVYELIFKKHYTISDKEVILSELNFSQAYYILKKVFFGHRRRNLDENKQVVDEYIHSRETMKILLRDLLPHVDEDKLSISDRMTSIIIALLHDVVEEDPAYAAVIERDFGPDVAKGVWLLSKKKWQDCMTSEEKKEYETSDDARKHAIMMQVKKERNHEYFKDLPTLELKYLLPKLADRIHNLKTLKWSPQDEIERKLQETKDYFLRPEIKKLSPQGYALIEDEVGVLEDCLKTLTSHHTGKDMQ